MSDLHRSSVHKRIARFPMLPPLTASVPGGSASQLSRVDENGCDATVMSASESADITSELRYGEIHAKRWSDGYFDEQRSLSWQSEDGNSIESFNAYLSHPAVSAPPEQRPIYIVFHHGAGYTGLSIGCVAKELKAMTRESQEAVGVLAIDCVGHGLTTSSTPEFFDLTRMSTDVARAVKAIWKPEEAPDFVLVGHSMGGAVMTEVAVRKLVPNVLGLAVLDVVEGAAVDAFQAMQIYIKSQPQDFASVEHAIAWHLDSGILRNIASASLSVPSLIRPVESSSRYTWRANIAKTRPFWDEWFEGLSNKFLQVPCGKLLMLAGTDRLDTPLTIGQMQGKYQLVVLPQVGHSLHEDAPVKTAETLLDFYRRNDRSTVINVKKVGQR